ncbi:MAG: D-alanine--D-alanine ligase [Cyanobacteria bacterium P01_A01_bin.116]
MVTRTTEALRILQLVGSATSEFYGDLSRLYAQDCMTALENPAKYTFLIAYVTPDGQWRFPASLADSDIAAARPMSLAAAMEKIANLSVDLALPQMFCIPGMTRYRALLTLLKIPFIGNLPTQMAIAADKAKAKAIVAAAGVRVPAGELLRKGDWPTILPRSIVKPNTADNSLGIALVESAQGYRAALENAFKHSSEVLVEEFIELGREVRCGIVVQNGELICLPLQEYRVDSRNRPIRTYDHKLKKNNFNKLDLTSKEGSQSWMVTDNDAEMAAVWEAAKACHIALGCRHYSLFDFRIDAQGQPWFLEAGLYCSFAPKSVVVSMVEAAGTALPSFFDQAIQACLTKESPKEKTLSPAL